MQEPFRENSSNTNESTVALWHGSLTDIPDGWVVADGNNGSPNLLYYFLRGTNSTPNGIDGQHSVNLTGSQMPSHAHSGSLSNAGGHSHSIGVEFVWQGNESGVAAEGNDSVKTDSAGSHSHGGSTANAGSGNYIDNRPPYYELAFIYKL